MSKLVYNELYKLFHKRSTKLYFILVFLLLTLSLVIVLKFDNSEENESNFDINYQQSIIDSYKDGNSILRVSSIIDGNVNNTRDNIQSAAFV